VASVDIWMHSASTHFVLVGATRVLIIYPAKKKKIEKTVNFLRGHTKTSADCFTWFGWCLHQFVEI
jgi:hypothetical protein